jgi:uncharacterized protein with PQ loop repeat
MGKYEGLIGIAGMLGLVSFGSLLLKIYETHNTVSLPWTWILMNLTAQVLSVIYGIANNSIGITIPCIIFVIGLMYIFFVKMYHKEYEKDKPKQL